MDARIVVLNGAAAGRHSNQPSTSTSSSDAAVAVRLENPRPKILRHNNDYADVFHRTTTAADGGQTTAGTVGGGLPPRIPLRFRRPTATNSSDVVDDGDGYGRHHFHRPCRTSSDRTTNFGEVGRHAAPPLQHNVVKLKSAPPSLLGVDDSVVVVSAQPAAATAKGHDQRRHRSKDDFTSTSITTSSSTIICARCGKCRCTDCAKPRQLPSVYLCNRTCLCSVDQAVDCVSCACCLKACIYHAGLENDDRCGVGGGGGSNERRPKIDNNHPPPSPPALFNRQTFVKWICYAGACLLLPCFWCYLPLKGVSKLSSFCYSKYYDNGCRCDNDEAEGAASRPRRSKSSSSCTIGCSYRNASSSRSRSLQPVKGHRATMSTCDKRLLVKSYSTGSDHSSSVVVRHKIDAAAARNGRRSRCNDYVLRTPIGGHQLDTRFLCDPPS